VNPPRAMSAPETAANADQATPSLTIPG